MKEENLNRPDDYHGEHRGKDGRFQKKFSGNPKGRPPRTRRRFDDEQMREDILRALEESTTITVGGKRQTVPIMQVIYKQLFAKAANGDVRCIIKAIELREKTIAAQREKFDSLVKLCVELEKRDPDDRTDEDIAFMQYVNSKLSDPYNPH